MRLYWCSLQMLFKKFILRQNTGKVIRDFATKMGVVYIKFAQILAMQNIGTVFAETDRQQLLQICDSCNPMPFSKIRKILQQEYGQNYSDRFQYIDPIPLGSASVSQVHRGILKDGTEVAIKIKRPDITYNVERDVRQIRKLIHRFGRFAHFRNLFGGDNALECYLDWIYQEVDFSNEQRNLQRYQDFANSVNGKIPDVKTKIVVPQLYLEYSTPNIIVMEYISVPTINQLELNSANKQKIIQAKNDYIRLSFYALFHQLPVVFHGDPHGGNIYIDYDNNIGFLDMGLIFEFSREETDWTRALFLSAYTSKVDYIIDLLQKHGKYEDLDWQKLRVDMQNKASQLQNLPVEQFFVEMIGIFTQYNIAVPSFLFKMAKAFLALFGLNTITGGFADTKDLLAAQITEFYILRSCDDAKNILQSILSLAPKFLTATIEGGLVHGLVQEVAELSHFSNQCQSVLKNCQEIFDLLKL